MLSPNALKHLYSLFENQFYKLIHPLLLPVLRDLTRTREDTEVTRYRTRNNKAESTWASFTTSQTHNLFLLLCLRISLFGSLIWVWHHGFYTHSQYVMVRLTMDGVKAYAWSVLRLVVASRWCWLAHFVRMSLSLLAPL